MYSPGNAVVVNLFMRWPVLIPVVACCVAAVELAKPTPPPVELPTAVIVTPAPAVVPAPAPLPMLPATKRKRG